MSETSLTKYQGWYLFWGLTICVVMAFSSLSVGEYDTENLILASQRIKNALDAGQWHADAATYPLSQYIPVMFYQYLFDGSTGEIFRFLSGVNALCLMLSIFLFLWVLLPIHRALGSFGALLLTIGPLIFQSRQTLNEVHAGFWTLLVVALCLKNTSKIWIILAIAMAGITKDIAPPMLLLLGLIAWNPWHGRTLLKFDRAKLLTLMMGCGVGILLNGLFNYFRYASWINEGYIGDGGLFVPILQKIIFSFALWFSPAVGIFAIWLPMGLVVAIGLGASLRSIFHTSSTVDHKIRFLLYLTTIGGLTLGFASWYSPFGWESYGQRLLTPWLPALALLMLYHERSAFLGLFNWLGRRPLLCYGLSVGLLVYATPHIFYFFDASSWRHYLHHEFFGLVIPQSEGLSFDGVNALTWRLDGFFPRGFLHFNPGELRGTILAYIVVLALGLKFCSQCLVADEGELNRETRFIHRGFQYVAGLCLVVGAAYWGYEKINSRGHGLKGEYFIDRNLSKIYDMRIDRGISFKWPGRPRFGMKPDGFSVRWTGLIFADEPGAYRFILHCDDGGRLWVKGQQLISDWNVHALNRSEATIQLEKGWHPIKVEYFDETAGAEVRLTWVTPGDSNEKPLPYRNLRAH